MTTVILKRPFDHEGKRYESITVDEPTVRALSAIARVSKDGGNDLDAIKAALCIDNGWPEEAFDNIRSRDIKNIREQYAVFLTELGEPETGDQSSPTSPAS